MFAAQRLRVGRTRAGVIVVDDHHFRVLGGSEELSFHAGIPAKPIRDTAALVLHNPFDSRAGSWPPSSTASQVGYTNV
jgi:hypothetical protein